MGVVYLTGQVSWLQGQRQHITYQAQHALGKIDALLAAAGTSKSYLLTAEIMLRDISKENINAVNKVWNDWLDPKNKPTRATMQCSLKESEVLVQIIVTATRN